jgi:hypothetical protein
MPPSPEDPITLPSLTLTFFLLLACIFVKKWKCSKCTQHTHTHTHTCPEFMKQQKFIIVLRRTSIEGRRAGSRAIQVLCLPSSINFVKFLFSKAWISLFANLINNSTYPLLLTWWLNGILQLDWLLWSTINDILLSLFLISYIINNVNLKNNESSYDFSKLLIDWCVFTYTLYFNVY